MVLIYIYLFVIVDLIFVVYSRLFLITNEIPFTFFASSQKNFFILCSLPSNCLKKKLFTLYFLT